MNNRDLIMIRTRKKYCIWALAATFGLLSALNLGSLHAADVTWHPGVMLNKVGVPRTESAPRGKFILSPQGYAIRNYVFLGWSERRVPVVRNKAAEQRVYPLYRVGDSLSLSQNTIFYAVWAVDADNNGSPDYQQAGANLRFDKEYIQKKLAELEQKRRVAEGGTAHRSSLRSAPVTLPKWDIYDDILAYENHVYFVDCVYNTDSVHLAFDPLINFGGEFVFQDLKHSLVRPAHDLELVFEYGGVLEDTCLIGGKDQKPLKRILYPKNGSPQVVDSLINVYPMRFTRIKEDGEAILKLYFVRKGTDTLANAHDTSDWIVDGGVGRTFSGVKQPFVNRETGEPSDTLTLRFQIYNQPEFAATSISTDILYGDTIYLKYAHLRGTPTKYMMRSFDGGWNWHPADSPLTDVERDLLQGDSVRVCLRQLDQAVGWAAYQKEGYLDPDRYPFVLGKGNANDFINEVTFNYLMDLYDKFPSTVQQFIRDTIVDFGWSTPWVGQPSFERSEGLRGLFDDCFAWPTPLTDHEQSLKDALTSNHYLLGSSFDAYIKDIAKRDFNAVYGKRLADKVATPAWCRNEPYCFYVSKGAVPIIERTVFIPRVEGVTVLSPELGQNSVRSQKDFTFRLKYAGKPMKVIAKRMIDGRVIGEVTGTPNADGEYEYVIRRVMQDITLEFTSADANTLVDQPSVWAYGGTLRIRSPKETTVRIYSAAGLLVKQVAVHGDTTVPLAAGLYMVVLSDGTTHKVIVQ